MNHIDAAGIENSIASKPSPESGYHKKCSWVVIVGASDSSGGAGIQADVATLHDLNPQNDNLDDHKCALDDQEYNIKASYILTAITSQSKFNTQVSPTSIAILQDQWDSLLLAQTGKMASEGECQENPRVIKIGLLTNPQQVKWLSERIKSIKILSLDSKCSLEKTLVVFDPVLSASQGGQLVSDGTEEAINQWLLPWIDVITPNLDELNILSTKAQSSPESWITACCKTGLWVLVKGGHGDQCQVTGEVCDRLVSRFRDMNLYHSWVETAYTRGTGCTLATAFTVFYIQMVHQDKSIPAAIDESIIMAVTYINHGLIKAQSLTKRMTKLLSGTSAYTYRPPATHACLKSGWPPTEVAAFPRVNTQRINSQIEETLPLGASEACKPLQKSRNMSVNDFAPWLKSKWLAHTETTLMGEETKAQMPWVYPVIESIDHLEVCLENQVPIVQMRLKTGSYEYKKALLRTAVTDANSTETALYINDEWQFALDFEAFGVHLGQEDLVGAPLDDLKEAGIALGISTHSLTELLPAFELKPSYIALGAVFSTKSKDMTGKILGLDQLHLMAKLCRYHAIPSVAIGGINFSRREAVAATGVNAMAVISAITKARDINQAVAAWHPMDLALT